MLPAEIIRKGPFDVPLLAGSTKGFSGAEIEQAVPASGKFF